MNPNDIERALGQERTVAPSADFTARVMRSVRQQVEEREGIAFPWHFAGPGLAACALLTIAGGVALLLGGGPPPVDPAAIVEALQRSALASAAAWLTMALSGSYVLVWGSLRMTGYQR